MKKYKKILFCTFIFYILVLTKGILFKYTSIFKLFSKDRVMMRGLNLVVIKNILNSRILIKDFIINVLIFIPLGIYYRIFKSYENFFKGFVKIFLFSFLLSLLFETSQYIFYLGGADINDLLFNTLGGVLGFIIISLIYKIFNIEKTNKVLAVLSFVAMLVSIPILLFIF